MSPLINTSFRPIAYRVFFWNRCITKHHFRRRANLTMGSKAGSTEHELRLKFLFANQDGIHVVLRFPKTATIAEAKTQLMGAWPQNVPPAEDAKSVRLVCMGRGILQDAHTLGSAVPAFDTHPTPVNVSVFHKSHQAVREATKGQAATKTVESAGCGCVIC